MSYSRYLVDMPVSTDLTLRCPILFFPRFQLRVRTKASEYVENIFSIFIMDENSDSSSSSEEELELMALAVRHSPYWQRKRGNENIECGLRKYFKIEGKRWPLQIQAIHCSAIESIAIAQRSRKILVNQ